MTSLKKGRDSANARSQPAASAGQKAAPPLSPRRRWTFRLLALVLVPLLVFGLLEGALRLCGYGYRTSFFRKVRVGDVDFLVNNDDFVLRFFPPEKARLPRPVMIEASKPPDVCRVFIFGESAAEGDPDPAFGPARFLEVLLRERFPRQKFEIVNVAITANNSHGILPIARECARHQGDLWIVYMGNNEMVGPFGAATVFGAQAAPLAVVRADLALQQTRVGQLITALGRRFADRPQSVSSWGGLEMFVENRIDPGDTRKETVYRNFERNLHDILKAGLDSGTRVVLSTMTVNLQDCPPLASMASTSDPAADRLKCDGIYKSATNAEDGGDFAGAARLLEQAVAIDPARADIQYQWGRSLLQLTNFVAAREHLQRACDDDALPARADSRINALIRAAAQQFAGTNLILFDSPSALAAGSATGICGSETFYEHVHFNLNGSYRLARAWAEQVEGLLPEAVRRGAAGRWALQPLCERRLALTDWNRRNDLSEIIGRRHAPPFSGQSNNAQQLAALETTVADLNRSMDAANAARAREICHEAIDHAPHDMDVHANFADFLVATGDLKQAAEQWRQVQQLMPEYYMGYFQEGRILERMGELEAARYAFEQTVTLRPAMAQAWFELSNIDASEGNLDLALEEIDHARQEQPHQPAFCACTGKLLARMNRHADAVERYRQALQMDPNYLDGRIALGEELAAAGNLPEAQSEFEACVKLRPDSARAHLDLGNALARQDRFDAARLEFDDTLRLDPGNKLAMESLRQIESTRAGRP